MAARSTGSGGTAHDAAHEALVRALRTYRPSKVVALVDGERRGISVPARKHRWEHVVRALDGLAWTRLECLDAKGDLVGSIQGEVEAADDAADAPVELALGAAPAGMEREHGLLVLMLKAQQVALAHQGATMRIVVEGFQSVAETAFRRLEALEAVQERTLKLAHEAAVRVHGAEPERDPNDELVMKLLDKSGVLGGGEKALEKTFERVARKVLPEGLLKPEPKKLPNGDATKEAT